MNHLSPDIYFEISKYLSRSDQPAFRRINKTSSQSDFNLSNCFREISPHEIARWLIKQQKILREDITKRKSILWNIGNPQKLTISLNYCNRATMGIYANFYYDLNTGDITDDRYQNKTVFNTEQDIVNYLRKNINSGAYG